MRSTRGTWLDAPRRSPLGKMQIWAARCALEFDLILSRAKSTEEEKDVER